MQAILAAIPAIQAEEDHLDEKYGIDGTMGINPFEEKAIQRTFEENPHEKELEGRLLTFDAESLLKAETLMYHGRDRAPSTFCDKLDYFRGRHDSKAELVRTLMEKIPACATYFRQAEGKLRQEGLTIDTI